MTTIPQVFTQPTSRPLTVSGNAGNNMSTYNNDDNLTGAVVFNSKGEKVGFYIKRNEESILPGKTKVPRKRKLLAASTNSMLERGLKIYAAVAPETQTTPLPLPPAPFRGIEIRSNKGLVIRSVQNTRNYLTVQNVGQNMTQNNAVKFRKCVIQSQFTNKLPTTVTDYSPSTNEMYVENIPQLFAMERSRSRVINSYDPSLPLASEFSTASIPPPIIPRPQPEVDAPKRAPIHWQFSPEMLKTQGDCKCELICKDMEENPTLYLGISKQEINILKILSCCCRLQKKQMFVIIRKLRQNESIEILSDLFELSVDEIIQIITDYVPKIAELFRKIYEYISKSMPSDYILSYLKFSLYKAHHLNEQPEEYSHCHNKINLKYLISCSHKGVINFISKRIERKNKESNEYENIGHLYKFLEYTKPKSIFLSGNEFKKVEFNYLNFKQVNYKKCANICYKMHIPKAIDGIKQFRILCSTEAPIRQEFYVIFDDIVQVVCALYNCKLT